MSLYAPTLARQKPPRWAPISRGLVAPEWQWAWQGLCYSLPFWEGGGMPASLEGRKKATSSGTFVWVRDKYGFALQGTGYPRLDFGDSTFVRKPTAALTVYIRTKWLGASTANGTLLVKHYGAGSPWNSYNIANDSTGSSGKILGGVTTGTTQVLTAASGTALPTTRFENIFLRWQAGEKIKLDILEDTGIPFIAQLLSTGTVSGTIPYTTDSFWLFGHVDNTSAFDAQISLCFIWARQLTDREMLLITQDPFAPFRMAEEEDYRVPSAGGVFFPYYRYVHGG